MANINGTEQEDGTIPTLIERCRSGDMSAFGKIMESHQQYAYALAFRVLRDDDLAKDVVQEAFIRVWKHIGAYRSTVKFTTWLYTIVVHLCYDSIKMRSRQFRIFDLFSRVSTGKEIPDSPNAGDTFERKSIAEHILIIAKDLPPKQQLVFMLRDVQDFTIEEIAETAKMSISTVKANLSYARRHIRNVYGALEHRGEI